MSYQLINREVWSNITFGLTNTQKYYLNKIINLHNRRQGQQKIVRLSSNCQVKLGYGVVFINNKTLCIKRRSYFLKIIDELIKLGRLTYICHSISRIGSGYILYINDYNSIISIKDIEFFIQESDLKPLSKISLLEGSKFDNSIKWEKTTRDQKVSGQQTTRDQKVSGQQKQVSGQKDINAVLSSTYEEKQKTEKKLQIRSNTNNYLITKDQLGFPKVSTETFDRFTSALAIANYDVSRELDKELG